MLPIPWLLRIDLFTSNFFRDHRKIAIIDKIIGHIGGVGIQEDMATWRDTHIRFTGSLVEDLSVTFQHVWQRAHKNTFSRFKKVPHFVKHFNILTNNPRIGHRHIHQTLLATIRNANNYMYLTTPYFIPDIRLFRVLRLAAKRGVDVRLILPENSDHAFVDSARESYYTASLRAGIKIFIYKPSMMHAKSMIIDGVWATTGSYNLDNLSSVFNHEANIASTDSGFISTLKQHFLTDLESSKEIVYEQWIQRPLRRKIFELLTWPFHGVM